MRLVTVGGTSVAPAVVEVHWTWNVRPATGMASWASALTAVVAPAGSPPVSCTFAVGAAQVSVTLAGTARSAGGGGVPLPALVSISTVPRARRESVTTMVAFDRQIVGSLMLKVNLPGW